MNVAAVVLGFAVILVVLGDAFSTIVLPRRVSQRMRPSRLALLLSWRIWTALAGTLTGPVGREGSGRGGDFLGVFGPLALLGLVALWAVGLITGFALLLWGTAVPMDGVAANQDFGTVLYLSGATFFTVGFGDVTPANGIGHVLAVVEGGIGFGFLAVTISYLPTIVSAVDRREPAITLLDARAGSPPTAAGYLSRTGADPEVLSQQLRDWEQWSAEVLESHLAYPILAFFRSQHEQQSWLATLVLILDVSALVQVGLAINGTPVPTRQARLTFAMTRHVAGDLCQILDAPPDFGSGDRLDPSGWRRLQEILTASRVRVIDPGQAEVRLAALRGLYEPYAAALSERTALRLPTWIPAPGATDDWQTTAWQHDARDVKRVVDFVAPAEDRNHGQQGEKRHG